MLSENNIIKALQRKFPVANGIGDDAAVLSVLNNKHYIVTQDLLIEDIHFRRKYFSAQNLAHKAIHVNLSDMAAMGGEPCYVLLGIAISKVIDEGYINDFLMYFSKICKTNKILLIGGDTTASPDKFFISVTVIGKANKRHLKLRTGANVGDVICVAGDLGYAHVGLTALEKSISGLGRFKQTLLKPKSRVQEGLWFSKLKSVTSLMDISDGLLVDLKRLCQASQVASEIYIDQLLTTKQFNQACKLLKLIPIETQLIGGEDYGLLLTIKSQHYSKIAASFLQNFGYPLQAIGKIKLGGTGKVNSIRNGKVVRITNKPFSHFGEIL